MIKTFFAGLVAAGCVTVASAQPQSRTLTLDDALSLTLTRNPAVVAADYQEAAARQERRAAIGLRMPQISVTGAYAYMGKDLGVDFNGLKSPVQQQLGGVLGSGLVPPEVIPQIQQLLNPLMGADWAWKLQDRSFGFVGGSVTLPIYMGGKINVANRAARIDEGTVRQQRVQTCNALVSELVERYYGLALATQVIAVRQQVVDGVRRHLEDAVALEESGMIARSERLYVEVKMAEAERDYEDALMQRATIASALSNTLGQEDDYRPVTAMFVVDAIEPLDHYRQLAADRNPLLAQVALKKQLAEEGVKLQRSAFLPQVAAMGGGTFYNYQVTDFMPRWAVGVGINLKLFDGLNREYKYSAARKTVQQVGALQEKAEADIGVLVEKLYTEMNNYASRVRSLETSLQFAEEYLKVKNAAFLEGMSSSADLIDAELNLAKSRIERLQAAYQFDVALARLLEAAGVSDEYAAYPRRGDARAITYDQH